MREKERLMVQESMLKMYREGKRGREREKRGTGDKVVDHLFQWVKGRRSSVHDMIGYG